MGVFSKLAFWKKKEPEMPMDMDLGGPDLGMPGKAGLGEMPELPGMPGMPEPGGMPRMGEGGGGLGMPELEKPAEAGPSPAESFQAPRLEESPEETGPMHPGYRPPPPPGAGAAAPPAAPEHRAASGKDLEIISLKLDSLKTTLEAINERLARLEKAAEGESGFGRRF